MKLIASLALSLLTTQVVVAQTNVCVPEATGVPTREGPPKWIDWADSGPIAVDTNLDDPRWVRSTGQTFERGSAKAPLQTRALYATQAGKEYLYLSFIIDLDAFDIRPGHESVARRRDVFLGFRRPDTTGTEKAYLFQFHLTGAGSGVSTPTPCDTTAACNEDNISNPALWHDYWRVFRDLGNTGVEGCSGNSETGHKYEALPAASVPWLTGPTLDSVRYWKLASSDPSPLLQNRWAVQVRIPMVAAVGPAASAIGTGIERGSTFFYEATGELDRPAATTPPTPVPLIDIGPTARIGWFPATLTNTVCPTINTVIHPEPAELALLTTSGAPAVACEGGITIDRDHIGVLFNQPPPADPEHAPLDFTFKAYDASNHAAPNRVVALPENLSSDPITAPLQARFRLAGWGSAPWSSTTDTGRWKDIRGAESGICAAGSPGACTPVTIAANKHGVISFPWQLGSDVSGIGDSEYCQFGLLPPTGTCVQHCSCLDVNDCAAGTGVRAQNATTWPCVPSVYQHDQCMLVELDSPNGNAVFRNQSIWRNMAFGAMSILSRDALIDARQLPTAQGQQLQDIYFVAIPRNMPASVPPGTTTVLLTQKAALASAFQIAKPYIEDLRRDERRRQLIRALFARAKKADGKVFGGDAYGGDLGHGTPDDELAQQIVEARVIMVARDFERVGNLLLLAANQGRGNAPHATLVEDAVKSVGSSAAAEIVPTLEFYPFYLPFGKGRIYQPMTSFAVFLSHEQTLSGMDFQIDGAERVGDNVYRMRIPVGFARRIQIRAQALVGGSVGLPSGNASWPCAGGCACAGGAQRRCGLVSVVGNTAPGLLAGVLVVRRRKRKPAKLAS